MTTLLKKISRAIRYSLEFGYVDGYCYSEDEWELLKVRHHSGSLYYCLVKIQTTELGEDIALYEVEIDDDDTAECILVGGDDDELDGVAIWQSGTL